MRGTRVFQQESFSTTKEWVYFCLEFGLQLCDGCLRKAQRSSGKPIWYCPECQPPIHLDLLQAIRTRSNLATTCHLCHESVNLRDSWISEDCQRLYCSSHLRPAADSSAQPVLEAELSGWALRERAVRRGPASPQRAFVRGPERAASRLNSDRLLP